MYRQVIEHPEWIPTEMAEEARPAGRPRQGADLSRLSGRQEAAPIPRLDKLDTAGLVAALDSPSGWQRDMVQQLLDVARRQVGRSSRSKRWPPARTRPACRVQALWTLELLGGLKPELIAKGARRSAPGVRRHAVRLAEAHLAKSPQIGRRILALADDADVQVQLQRAYTLGEWNDPASRHGAGRTGAALFATTAS